MCLAQKQKLSPSSFEYQNRLVQGYARRFGPGTPSAQDRAWLKEAELLHQMVGHETGSRLCVLNAYRMSERGYNAYSRGLARWRALFRYAYENPNPNVDAFKAELADASKQVIGALAPFAELEGPKQARRRLEPVIAECGFSQDDFECTTFHLRVASNTFRWLQAFAEGDLKPREVKPFSIHKALDLAWSEAMQKVPAGHDVVFVKTRQSISRVSAELFDVVQLLSNLIRNASRAIDTKEVSSKGTITLTVSSGAMVQVDVRDTGPGIPVELLPHIFEPGVTTSSGEGHGLGLSIARRVVTAYGGEISAANRPEGGAQFTIKLPIAATA